MSRSLTKTVQFLGCTLLLAAAPFGCKKTETPAGPTDKTVGGENPTTAPATGPKTLSGTIKADGSSTVFPVSEAVAEEFGKKESGVRVTVGTSGTGGGFKKFCAGETDISDASRPIKDTEIEACKAGGVEYVELPIAYDGLSVVVNKANPLNEIKVDELKKIWAPEAQGKVMKWKDVNPKWPDKELHLFGAGVDSGTYDYFTEAVVGKSHSSRGDYTASEDDNVLVTGVAGDPQALGFFGFAYYVENKDKLKVLKIDAGKGAVEPTLETIANGTYAPLSRPLFIYVNKKAFDRPEVAAFVDFYLSNAKKLAAEVGYVALPDKAYELVKARSDKRTIGTVFVPGKSTVGMTIEQLLQSESAAPAAVPATAPAPAPATK
jgi:phosphate transport system substrate-binding protein